MTQKSIYYIVERVDERGLVNLGGVFGSRERAATYAFKENDKLVKNHETPLFYVIETAETRRFDVEVSLKEITE